MQEDYKRVKNEKKLLKTEYWEYCPGKSEWQICFSAAMSARSRGLDGIS